MATVYIQYNSVPHYRKRIFEVLSGSSSHDYTIIADADSETPYMKVADTNQLRYLFAKTYKFKIPLVPEFYFQPKSLLLISRDRPSIVIVLANPYSITAWIIAVWGKLTRTPVFFWGHGLLDSERGIKGFVRGIFYKLAYGHLLYGDRAKQLLVASGFDAARLFVIYNSLNYESQVRIRTSVHSEDIKEFKRCMGAIDESRIIVFTGRLQKNKKIELLINALGVIRSNGLNVHLILVGQGSENANLRNLANKLGLTDFVHMLGAVYDEQKLALIYLGSDLCVIPSGAGLTVMHSLVYGTPVLVNDDPSDNFPEVEAIKEGVTGLFYRRDDLEDLVNKIESALYPKRLKLSVSTACMKVIDLKYNPQYQLKVINEAVDTTLRHAARVN